MLHQCLAVLRQCNDCHLLRVPAAYIIRPCHITYRLWSINKGTPRMEAMSDSQPHVMRPRYDRLCIVAAVYIACTACVGRVQLPGAPVLTFIEDDSGDKCS